MGEPDVGNRRSLAGKAAWAAGGLELSPDASDRVIRKRLSASSAKGIRSCAARWALDSLLPRSERPFGAAELGTATHQLLEDLYALPAGERSTDSALVLLSDLDARHGAKLASPDDPIELDSWRQEIWRRAAGLWALEDPDSVDVLHREIKLVTNVAGVPYIGYVDRLDRGGDGRAVVVDYKAGLGKIREPNKRYGDDYGDQVRLYAAAITSARPDLAGDDPLEVSGRLLYVAHRHERVVNIDAGSLDATLSAFAGSWERQAEISESRVFPTNPTALCGWCPAVEVCPAAAAKRLGPRDPNAYGGAELGIAAAGRVIRPAAPTSEEMSPIREERIMAYKHEGKNWEEVTPETSELNPNSYAATSVFGMSGMAVEALHAAGQPVTGPNVRALAQTFASLIAETSVELGYRPSYQSGLHTRLRGALHTCLDTIPAPFGDDLEAWQAWRASTRRRMLAIAKTAISLWESDIDEIDVDAALAVLATPRLAAVAGGKTPAKRSKASAAAGGDE